MVKWSSASSRVSLDARVLVPCDLYCTCTFFSAPLLIVCALLPVCTMYFYMSIIWRHVVLKVCLCGGDNVVSNVFET